MNIFEIEKQYLELIELLEESEGEVTDEISQLININQNEVKNKLQQFNYLIHKISAEMELGVFEIKRIKKALDRKQKVVDKLLEYSKIAINSYGLESKISKAKNKPKEVLLDNDLKAVLSFTEAVEINKEVSNNNLSTLPADLKPFTNVNYFINTDLSDFEEIREPLLLLLTKSKAKTEIGLSFSKSEIKKAINEGVIFENAEIKLNENINFK